MPMDEVQRELMDNSWETCEDKGENGSNSELSALVLDQSFDTTQTPKNKGKLSGSLSTSKKSTLSQSEQKRKSKGNNRKLKSPAPPSQKSKYKLRSGSAIPIIAAWRQGNAKPRAIVVNLQNIRDKGTIYKHAKNLKDARNTKDEKYFVNDQLPPSRQEIQRRQRAIAKHYKSQTGTATVNITYQKGQLLVNNTLYRKQVVCPTVEQLCSPENLSKVDACQLHEGETQKVGDCRFVPYSQEVASIEDVRNGYVKVKRMHPTGLSVMLGYNIPGSDYARLSDFYDDKEHGGGRVIWQVLTQSKITYRAIYVVRHYGGKHLGPTRFDAIRNATYSAIARNSYNKIIQSYQFVSFQNVDKGKKGGRPYRVRGRGSLHVSTQRRNASAQNTNDGSERRDSYSQIASPTPFSGGIPSLSSVSNLWQNTELTNAPAVSGSWDDILTASKRNQHTERRPRIGSFGSVRSEPNTIYSGP